MTLPRTRPASQGIILAAPTSGSGKTTVTLGVLRALSRNNQIVRGAKSGPDYIDPRFHEAACGQPCRNLDAWAMSPDRIRSLAQAEGLTVIEGAMGLFDGAPPDGKGATADLARVLGVPVVLIVDAARMSQSVAALVAGFAAHDPEVRVAGVILNRVGSPRHEAMLRRALAPLGLPVLGAVPRQNDILQPSRHLGLVQAQERPDLEDYLNRAADLMEQAVDLNALAALAADMTAPVQVRAALPPPAQSIAVAQDQAFAFAYPHLLEDWRAAGATLHLFSPLSGADIPKADLIYLPGGYPELHAGILSQSGFLGHLKNAAHITDIYGECGGFMVLGDGLVDAQGNRHEMAGLLRLETSFEHRRLHLGYRRLHARLGVFPGAYKGHEFHYSTTLRADGTALFDAQDAEGTDLGAVGLINGRTSGSFAHLIDIA